MKTLHYSFLLFLSVLFFSCDSGNTQSEEEKVETVQNEALKKVVEEYFATYSTRKDFSRFMSFYSENAVLDDVIYGARFEGKDSIAHFFDWNYGAVEFDTTKGFVQINKMAVGQNFASVEGKFAPFKLQGQQNQAWRFTTWLTFNKDNKIILHVDYIDYPRELLQTTEDSHEGHNHD